MVGVYQQLLQEAKRVKKIFRIVAYMFKWKALIGTSREHLAKGMVSNEEIYRAKIF